MAESIVIHFTDKLTTLISEEAKFLIGVEEQFVLLRDEFELIRSFLRDAEKKRIKSHLVEAWVTQIRDIAYDAEDVIDAYMLHLEQQKTMNWVRKIFNSRKQLKTLHKIRNQIELINTRARRISACRSDYNIDVEEITQDSNTTDMRSIRRGIPTIEEIEVVGFRNESVQVINLLKDEGRRLKVIPIVGMGGLGKTTLAQKIYKNSDVTRAFDTRVWISVSQEYKIKDILVSALKQVLVNYSSDLETNEELKEELCRQLNNKKYLLIIDDLWKAEAWDQISWAFPNNSKGSRVILTTRIKEVALRADLSNRNHLHLRLLNKNESWELFCKKVFSMPVADCPSDFVKVGKEIADKCGGLPLAIVVIGGLLLGKERRLDAWLSVLKSVNWYLSQNSNQCRQILILSYSSLPYYLKSCFLYLGLFPEDSQMDAEEVIRLWVADGFVQIRGQLNMEDVAEDCLEELVQRSLIQVTSRKYHGGPVESFRVHDLLRDIAISEGKKDRFMENHTSNNPSASTTKPRRLAIHSSSISGEDQFFTPTAPNLRCLLFFRDGAPRFSNCSKMLRVLELKGVKINKHIPREIGKLISLHYLGLGNTGAESLSSSIGNLVKLQTLDLRETRVRMLPKSIWKLKNLRHLLLTYGCGEVKGGGDNMEDFGRNLLTLRVRVPIWMNEDGTGLSNVIVKQDCLRSLSLSGKLAVSNLKNCFPSSLVELFMLDTLVEEDPSDILGSLPFLKSLYLITSYTGRKMVFSSGKFSSASVFTSRAFGKLDRVEGGGWCNTHTYTSVFISTRYTEMAS